MANFNLADYETVEERIKRFYKDHPDGRILTENLTTLQDRQVSTWVVKASIYLTIDEQALGAPKATGLAYEIDSAKGPQATSALEVCETSAIGRALANAGYSGNKRASREEMAKVQRGATPTAPSFDPSARDAVVKQIANATTKDQLRQIWQDNLPNLDAEWTNSLDEQVSLKNLIIAKQGEMK